MFISITSKSDRQIDSTTEDDHNDYMYTSALQTEMTNIKREYHDNCLHYEFVVFNKQQQLTELCSFLQFYMVLLKQW